MVHIIIAKSSTFGVVHGHPKNLVRLCLMNQVAFCRGYVPFGSQPVLRVENQYINRSHDRTKALHLEQRRSLL